MKNPYPHSLSRTLLLLGAICTAAASSAEELLVKSGENQAVLLELYTSEGCSSCPPADRWISALKAAEIGTDKVVPLAFHVTYWDYIGWKDRFGNRDYDNRQRDIATHNLSRTIYTPQFVFNGKDFRGMRRFIDEMKQANQKKAPVTLEARVNKTLNDKGRTLLDVTLKNRRSPAIKQEIDLYLSVYENALSTEVHRGENAGRELSHDYVVRHLSGPYRHRRGTDSYQTQARIQVGTDWDLSKAGIVIFAQERSSGRVIQAASQAFGKDF